MTLSNPPIESQTRATPDTLEAETEPDFGRGLAYLKTQVKTLPHQPGVYRMTGADGEALYVGKARHLARRGQQLYPAKQIVESASADGCPDDASGNHRDYIRGRSLAAGSQSDQSCAAF